MELDDMKKIWSEMSIRVEKQEKITNEIILNWTKEKSRNRLRRLINLEILGMCCSLAGIILIALNFYRLNTTISFTGGIISVIILAITLAMGIDFIKKGNKINVSENNYKQALINFNKWKKSYHFNRYLAYWLGLALIVGIAPVVFKINRTTEITEVPLQALLAYLVAGIGGTIILFFVLFRFFYKKQINEISQILKNLQE